MTSYEATATPMTLLELVTTITKCGVREADVVAIAAELDQARRRTRALGRRSDVEPEEIPVDPAELRLSPAIEQALEQLPTAQREAVWMLKIDGLSVSEAAERARVTSGALKLRAHRGYRSLRDLLGRELL